MENLVNALKLTLLLMSPGLASASEETLIRGTVVPNGTRPEVVLISSSGSRCTATIVSNRVIITAAHCVTEGSKATFAYGQNRYSSTCSRSPIYPRKDHDLALCVTDEKIDGAKPATVDLKKLEVGEKVEILGYGCTRPGGGQTDGQLRSGEATVTGYSNYDVVTQQGVGLCYGDSGGPMMRSKKLVAVNSKGYISDTNYNLQLSLSESVDFMKAFAEKNSVEVCGVTSDCAPAKPTHPCVEEKSVVEFFTGKKTSAEKEMITCQGA